MMDPLKSMLGLIAKSPFKPLSEHAEKVRLTVWKMSDALNAYVEGDMARVDALYREITEMEHEADIAKQEIRQNLPSSNIMPVDRADTLSYLKQQDDVANSAENVAEILTIKMVPMPRPVRDSILRLKSAVLKTVEEHVSASSDIITILDTAFSPDKVRHAQELIDRVDAQKHAMDVARLEAMKSIYAHEAEIGPTGVYQLMSLVKELGWVAEHAESSTNRLRLMIARR